MRVDPAADKRKPGPQLPGAIAALVTDPESISVFKSLSEVIFDAALDDGILKEVPTVGTLFSFVRLPWSIRDRIFLKKLSRFVYQLATVPEEQLRKFRDKINADPKFRDRVGEKVLLVIERADDMEKAPLLGRALAAFIEGKVTEEEFMRMTAGIDRALMDDINRLTELEQTNSKNSCPWAAGLMSAGLAGFRVSGLTGGTYTFYLINDIGKLVLKHCVARSADSEG
jgi:hypothetical protein